MEVNAMAKGGNPRHLELIRRINRSLILNMVKERQPVSRAQLHMVVRKKSEAKRS